MAMLSALGDSQLGLVESAVLLIKDYRSLAEAKDTDESVLSKTTSALSGQMNSLVSNVANSADKTFTVQFNPQELQIYASCLKQDKADARAIDENKRGLTDSYLTPTVELTVNLIFDQVHNDNAFMYEKLNKAISTESPGALASSIAAVAGKTWTVQTEVEGIIAALRNPYTRTITFQWADFSFAGVLKFVNASYTMFSVSGHPIRAKVMLRLRQNMDVRDLSAWYKEFDFAFGGQTNNLMSIAQDIGSLMNLKL